MPSAIEVRNRVQFLLEQIELSTGRKETEIPGAKRSSWRRMWVSPATIEFVDSKDSSEPVYITTRSISAHGVDFRSSRMPKPGCKLLMSLETDHGELQIPATVMHSTQSVGMPITGVRFDLH